MRQGFQLRLRRISWKHYEQLDRVSVDSDFDFEWKEVVEGKVSMCSSLSEGCVDEVLEIAKSIIL